MREMQCREQGRFVAGIQRCHKVVEDSERRAYRRLIGLGLSSVDSDRPSGAAGHLRRPFGSDASADCSAEDTHIVAAGDLSGLLWAKATAQHRRNEMHTHWV